MNIHFIGNIPLVSDPSIKLSSFFDLWETLENEQILGLDIETTQRYGGKYKDEGLDPYTSKIIMLQIGTKDDVFVIDMRVLVKLPNALKHILEDDNRLFVGHNIKFEYKHILHNYKIMLNNVYDTMVGGQIIYNGIGTYSYNARGDLKFHPYRHSLKDACKRHLNIDIEKETRNSFPTIGSRPFKVHEIIYGANDVLYPLKIRERQLDLLDNRGLLNVSKLEMKFIPVIGDIELRGMCFNREAWLDLYEHNKKLFDLQIEKLNRSVIKRCPISPFIEKQLDLFDSSLKCNIQWTSSKQVIEYFNYLGLNPTAKSKTTGLISPTVDAKVLGSYKRTLLSHDNIELVEDYMYLKELEQLCTTFGKDFLKYVNSITGRIHSNYKQILNTGRISSSNPNLQNIPSDNRFRACFDSYESTCIVNADYSGQEQIILVNKSLEPNLIKFYEEGETDMHSYIARALYPVMIPPNTPLDMVKRNFPDKRQEAKAAGFAINYGGNGSTIAKNLGVSKDQGDAVYDLYFKAFPKLREYFDKIQEESWDKGYVLIDKITGRKWFFDKRYVKKHDIDKKALNYPIQGEAGSITKLACIMFREEAIKSKDYFYFYGHFSITNIVHDEINVESLKGPLAQDAANLLEDCMKKAADVWCKKVKMTAVAKIGNYWSH